MYRRAVLGRLGVVGAAALAGCASSNDPDGSDGDGGTGPRVTDTEFTVTSRESGTQASDATAGFGEDAVTVDGTIWGANGCKTAELASAEYDAAADELTVAVETADREDAGDGCTEAIVEIEYEATVTFAGGLPGRVVVTHDHGDGPQQVASAER